MGTGVPDSQETTRDAGSMGQAGDHGVDDENEQHDAEAEEEVAESAGDVLPTNPIILVPCKKKAFVFFFAYLSYTKSIQKNNKKKTKNKQKPLMYHFIHF